LQKCLDIFLAVETPMVLVAGNNESTDELSEACRGRKNMHVLHGSGVTIAATTFFGIGGGVPVAPFGSWSYDFTEPQAEALLLDCPADCVLVSHSPPKGAVDVSSRGQSLGSSAVRSAIERVKPRLVVCGHIHGSAGERATIGEVPVINAGPEGVEWELR
jgi:Icc-related predicted phosphoesterase